jgi:Carboxypeptidase regulatory-like domain/TonB-dependent Receptor Plug Domain
MKLAITLVVGFLCLSLSVPMARAQEQTGALQGRASDSSGGVLPGVTVTISGPAILGGSRTTVTSENGTYRLPNLPVGTYRVSFELAGFGSRVHEGVRILAATTFTLDGKMDIASVAESVTVSGASPVIDTAATDVGFTFTKEIMTTVPNARDVWAMVAQTPGVTTSNVNVGGTQTGNQVSFRGHGVDPRQNTYILNGANVTDNTNNGASQFFFDVDSFEEMKVEVNAHSAEVQTPGMLLNIVPKSGADRFSGTTSIYYGNDSIQADNVDEELRARGVNRASNLHKYLDGATTWAAPSCVRKPGSGRRIDTKKSRTSSPGR